MQTQIISFKTSPEEKYFPDFQIRSNSASPAALYAPKCLQSKPCCSYHKKFDDRALHNGSAPSCTILKPDPQAKSIPSPATRQEALPLSRIDYSVLTRFIFSFVYKMRAQHDPRWRKDQKLCAERFFFFFRRLELFLGCLLCSRINRFRRLCGVIGVFSCVGSLRSSFSVCFLSFGFVDGNRLLL